MNINPSISSQQPIRSAISLDRLRELRTRAIGVAIETSTYGSALNSYLSFIDIYNLPSEPTPDTLSLYVVFMCEHIKPQSVETYLTGLCHELTPYFPDVAISRRSQIVIKTMKGCKKLEGLSVSRKRALTTSDLTAFIEKFPPTNYNNILFIAMLITGFFSLLRLGELTYPKNINLRSPHKVIRRASVTLENNKFSFILPFHKADKSFEGNKVVIGMNNSAYDPQAAFHRYLQLRDEKFPFHSQLWLTEEGLVPTRSFFIRRLRTLCDTDSAGQSLRAGGATLLALNGTAPYLIQAIGRWSPEAWQIYIRKNPVIVQALLCPENVTT